MSEHELLALVVRVYPSFQSLDPAELLRRAEAIGMFAATAWAQGPDALKAQGVEVPPETHAALAQGAARVAQAGKGGMMLLQHLRARLADDARFARALVAIGALFARSRQSAPAPPAPAPAAPASAPAAPPKPAAQLSDDTPGGRTMVFKDILATPDRPAPAAAPAFELALEPPRAPGKTDAFLRAVLGGGLAPEAPPAPAPATAPAAAAAPRPQAARPSADEPKLDLMPEDDAPKAAPAPASKSAAPKPQAKLTSLSKSFSDALEGGLDLLPEDDAPKKPAPDALALADEPPAAPKAKADPKKTSSSARVKTYTGDDDEDDKSGKAEEKPPDDPALAAIWRWHRTGDRSNLEAAFRIHQQELQKAPHPAIAAAAEAGLARIHMLRGEAQAAEERARAALEKDPGCPFAVEVLVRLAVGDATRGRLELALGAVRMAIRNGRGDEAQSILSKTRSAFPTEPQPLLALAYIAKATGDQTTFDKMLREAWSTYPSPELADVPLGGELDEGVAAALVAHGRAAIKSGDPATLKQTVENVDDRENLIAGAPRLGIAVARVALLEATTLTARRRLLSSMGSGLIALQHYDHATEVLNKAAGMIPSESEQKVLDNERRFANQLRRAFDKPGIKAQLGHYRCVATAALTESLQRRLAKISEEMGTQQRRLDELATQLSELLKDPRTRATVKDAAQKAGVDLPLDALDAAEHEIAETKNERARLTDESSRPKAPAPSGGFFSKLKDGLSAAASGISAAAKDAQLKHKETQAEAKRAAAARELALVVVRELRDAQLGPAGITEMLREAATCDAWIEACREEDKRARKKIERLAELG